MNTKRFSWYSFYNWIKNIILCFKSVIFLYDRKSCSPVIFCVLTNYFYPYNIFRVWVAFEWPHYLLRTITNKIWKQNRVTATTNSQLHAYIYIYMFVVVNFDALAQASDIHQGLRHQIASRLNAHWQTDWAIMDQAKNLNSPARPYDQRAFSPLDPTAVWHSHLALAIYIYIYVYIYIYILVMNT